MSFSNSRIFMVGYLRGFLWVSIVRGTWIHLHHSSSLHLQHWYHQRTVSICIMSFCEWLHFLTLKYHVYLPNLSTPKMFKTKFNMSLCLCICVRHCKVTSDSSGTPWTVARILWALNSPVKNTKVDCRFLLQRIIPTQGWNLCLMHCRQILYYWATWEVCINPAIVMPAS